MSSKISTFSVLTAAMLAAASACAELRAAQIARLAPNPVGNLNVGPDSGRRTSSTSSR